MNSTLNLQINTTIISDYPLNFAISMERLARASTVSMTFSRTEDLKYQMYVENFYEGVNLRTVSTRLDRITRFIQGIAPIHTFEIVSGKILGAENSICFNIQVAVEHLSLTDGRSIII